MSFELRQLKHALAVADHGNFAQAAISLHISQSALSRSVQALEREVGEAIFRRSPQGVSLTDTGRDVLRRGREMMALAEELDSRFLRNRSLQGGCLAVGVGSAATEVSAVDATRQFAAEFPTVRIELRAAYRTDLLPALRDGQIHLLLADGTLIAQEPDLEVEHLESHPLVAFVRPGHPLARRRDVTLPDLFAFPLMSLGRIHPGLLAPLLAGQAAAASPAMPQRALTSVTCNSLAMLERLVRESDAVASASPSALRQSVEAGRVVPLMAPPWLHTAFGVGTVAGRPACDASLSFRRHLRRAHALRCHEDRRLLAAWFGTPTEALP